MDRASPSQRAAEHVELLVFTLLVAGPAAGLGLCASAFPGSVPVHPRLLLPLALGVPIAVGVWATLAGRARRVAEVALGGLAYLAVFSGALGGPPALPERWVQGVVLSGIVVFLVMSWTRGILAPVREGIGLVSERVRRRTEVAEAEPGSAMAQVRLAEAWEDEHEHGRAIVAYKRAIVLQPELARAHAGLGEAFRKSGVWDAALAAYEAALALEPSDPYALAGTGETLRMQGEHEASLGWFDRALAARPDHPFALQGKAASLNELQRYAEALPLWARAVAVAPDSEFAAAGKAWTERQLAAQAAAGAAPPPET